VGVVGPGFYLVPRWAIEGGPLRVACPGISATAERHKAGRSTRPLRLEFCEHDVRAAYDAWRRAVGVSRLDAGPDDEQVAERSPRHGSIVKHLDRVLDRLARVAGRLDLPDAFRDAIGRTMADVGALRDAAKAARGAARDATALGLPAVDDARLREARAAVDAAVLERLGRDAAAELDPYRGRLPADMWAQSMQLGVDRLLRDHLGLPVVVFDA
jgi:hypothetical protein